MTDTLRKPQSARLNQLVADRLSKATSEEERERILRDVAERYRMLAELQPQYADRWDGAREELERPLQEEPPPERAEFSPLLGRSREERERESVEQVRLLVGPLPYFEVEPDGSFVLGPKDVGTGVYEQIRDPKQKMKLLEAVIGREVTKLRLPKGLGRVTQEDVERQQKALDAIVRLDTIRQSIKRGISPKEALPLVQKDWQKYIVRRDVVVGMARAGVLRKPMAVTEGWGAVGTAARAIWNTDASGLKKAAQRGVEAGMRWFVGPTLSEWGELITGEPRKAPMPTAITEELIPKAHPLLKVGIEIALLVGTYAAFKAVKIRTGVLGAQRKATLKLSKIFEKGIRKQNPGMATSEIRARARTGAATVMQIRAKVPEWDEAGLLRIQKGELPARLGAKLTPRDISIARLLARNPEELARMKDAGLATARQMFPGTFTRLQLSQFAKRLWATIEPRGAAEAPPTPGFAAVGGGPSPEELRKLLAEIGKTAKAVLGHLKQDKELLGSIVAYVAAHGTQGIPVLDEMVEQQPSFAALVKKAQEKLPAEVPLTLAQLNERPELANRVLRDFELYPAEVVNRAQEIVAARAPIPEKAEGWATMRTVGRQPPTEPPEAELFEPGTAPPLEPPPERPRVQGELLGPGLWDLGKPVEDLPGQRRIDMQEPVREPTAELSAPSRVLDAVGKVEDLSPEKAAAALEGLTGQHAEYRDLLRDARDAEEQAEALRLRETGGRRIWFPDEAPEAALLKVINSDKINPRGYESQIKEAVREGELPRHWFSSKAPQTPDELIQEFAAPYTAEEAAAFGPAERVRIPEEHAYDPIEYLKGLYRAGIAAAQEGGTEASRLAYEAEAMYRNAEELGETVVGADRIDALMDRVEAAKVKMRPVKAAPGPSLPKELRVPAAKTQPARVKIGAKVATQFEKGKVELAQVHAALIEYGQKYLPPKQSAKLAVLIAKAHTEKELTTLARRMDKLITANRIKELAGGTFKGILISPRELVTYAMRHEAKAARKAWKAGQVDLEATQADIITAARKNLPPEELHRILPALKKLRTPGERRAAAASLNRIFDSYDRASALKSYKEVRGGLDVPKLRPTERRAVTTLLDAYAERVPLDKTVRSRTAILEYFEKVDDPNADPLLLASAHRVIRASKQTPLRKLPPDSIRMITRALQHLKSLSDRKNQLIFSQKLGTAKKAIGTATKEVVTYSGTKYWVPPGKPGKPPTLGRPGGPLDKFGRAWFAFKKFALPMQESIDLKATLLAGENSVTHKLLYQQLMEGHRTTQEIRNDSMTFVEGALGKAGYGKHSAFKGLRERVTVKLPTATTAGKRVPTVSLTRHQMMQAYAETQDPRTMHEHIKKDSPGVTIQGLPGGPIVLRGNDLRAITEALPPKLKTLADKIIEDINARLGPILNKAWVKAKGYDLIVDERTYVPRRRDPEYIKTEPDDMLTYWAERQLDRQSFTQARSPTTRAPLLWGETGLLGIYMRHSNGVAAFAGKHAPSLDAERLLKAVPFRRAVRAALGDKMGHFVTKDMEATVREYRQLETRGQGEAERILRAMTRRATVGVLAWKPWVVANQVASMFTAWVEMDAKYLARAMAGTCPNANEVIQHSPLLQTRYRLSGWQLLTPDIGVETLEQFSLGRTPWEKTTMGPIRWGDRRVINRIAQAAYHEATDLGLSGEKRLDAAARRTEFLVHRTQPTYDPLTTPSLAREARRNIAARMLMLFRSQLSKNLQVYIREYSSFFRGPKTAKDWQRFTKVNTAMLLQAATIYLIYLGGRKLRRWFAPEATPATWDKHAWGIAERVINSWSIFGPLITTAAAWMKGRPPWKRENILNAMFTSSYLALHHWTKAVAALATGATYKSGPRKGQPKWPVEMSRAIEHSGKAIGSWFGLPTQAILQMVGRGLPHRAKKSKKKKARLDSEAAQEQFQKLVEELE